VLTTENDTAMFESKSGVLFIAGLAFFFLAFASNAMVPIYMYRDLPEQQVDDLVNQNLLYQFEDLHKRFQEPFETAFGTPPEDDAEAWYAEKCADALLVGRKVYTGEGCWHCHSQFVRPVSREEDRWGAVAEVYEYQNELQRPVLFGTRRVGPDLSREGGRRSNDWHTVHFFRPQMLEPTSPMPEYPWLFDGAPDQPNEQGLALITYVQWLGSWLESYPYYERFQPISGDESGMEDE
jgi:hypothetical protein